MTPRIKKMQDDWLLRHLEQVGHSWRCSFWLSDDIWLEACSDSLKKLLRQIKTVRMMRKKSWPKSCRSAYDAYPFKGGRYEVRH